MEMLKVVNILILMYASVAIGFPEDEVPCCPRGQAILRRRSQPSLCWDSNDNSTTYASIACEKTGILAKNEQMDFIVNEGGELVISLPNREVYYDPGTFCIAQSTVSSATHVERFRRVAVVCIVEAERIIDDSIYGYCMIVSSIFLFLTAAIYACRRELRDLQGKSIINFCASLGLGLGILAGMKLVAYSDMNLCAARGFFAYFFVIASFFWMNAISIQIFLNMRRLTCADGWKEFSWYALYAWGCPAVLTSAMAVVNFMPGDHLKPGIGLNHCWFFDDKQQWSYMYSVISVLVAVNICIFIYSAIVLWHLASSTHKKAFVTTLRLLVVMGVPWIFEMVGSLAPAHLVWEVLDLINSLQGVFIFLALVALPRRKSEQDDASVDSGTQYNLNITIDQPYKKILL